MARTKQAAVALHVPLGLFARTIKSGTSCFLVAEGHEMFINAIHPKLQDQVEGDDFEHDVSLLIRGGDGEYVTLFSPALGVFSGPLRVPGPSRLSLRAVGSGFDVVGSVVAGGSGGGAAPAAAVAAADGDDGKTSMAATAATTTTTTSAAGRTKPTTAQPELLDELDGELDHKAAHEEKKLQKKARKEEAKKKQLELEETLKRQREEGAKVSSRVEKEGRKRKKTLIVMKERTLKGKVKAQDLIIGSGSQPLPGRMVHLLYEGSLEDGTVFDKNQSRNNPFKFRVGLGKVIKGLEIGIADMRVGGERTITIPPAQGYGDKRMGKIPPGSTLIFSVKLLDVENRG